MPNSDAPWVICPRCGYENYPDDKGCIICGPSVPEGLTLWEAYPVNAALRWPFTGYEGSVVAHTYLGSAPAIVVEYICEDENCRPITTAEVFTEETLCHAERLDEASELLYNANRFLAGEGKALWRLRSGGVRLCNSRSELLRAMLEVGD